VIRSDASTKPYILLDKSLEIGMAESVPDFKRWQALPEEVIIEGTDTIELLA
jgi:hypothetical protein